MLGVLGCLSAEHDHLLVVLAALVCCISGYVTFSLLARVRSSRRGGWLIFPALAAGIGAWSTHFIAMLAYSPGLPTGFMPALTALTAIISPTAAMAGMTLWARAQGRADRLLGGAVIGLGVGVMHYVGMAAMQVPGHLEYNPQVVIASILFGTAIIALALSEPPPQPGHRLGWTLRGSAAFILGVVLLHFTGMGAVTIVPDGAVAVGSAALDHRWLATLIAGITGLTLAGGVCLMLLGAWLRARAEAAEADRTRSLADASFEGLILCDAGGVISDVNRRFVTLTGESRESLIGRDFHEMLFRDGERSEGSLQPRLREPQRAMLLTQDGPVPVDVLADEVKTTRGMGMALAVRDVRERIAAEARMLHLAHHDPLTDLANRARLQERLTEAVARARRNADGFSVICLDLDRFKAVNDLFGHAVGDALLQAVASRLLAAVREGDTVARVGGDEFVIIQEKSESPADIAVLARRLLDQLGRPFRLGDQELTVCASIGIALYPTDGVEPEVLLANADLALYRVKEHGRNGFAFFRPEMEAGLRERRALELDLNQALERNEFWLAWQPQLDVHSGEVAGFEALLRWEHPTRGNVPPSDFIALAEATGAIVQIGAWVLRTACREAAGWDKKLRCAVNVSSVQIQQDGFTAVVRDALAESGLEPSRLEIEVTESLLIHDPARALEALRAVKAMGADIAIDDFGTGYSSLSTLQSFPFDRLKIDRSFVNDIQTNPQSAAIVRAIISLSQCLGLPVVAEGIETQEQLDSLMQHDSIEAQGFLIGRPSNIGSFSAITGNRQQAKAAGVRRDRRR